MATATEPLPANGTVRNVSLLDQIAEEQERTKANIASRYMPTLSPKQFTEREKLMKELREMLVENIDYGVIPGTEKPTLYLAGAQKVCAYFGYVPRYSYDAVIEDWDGSQYGEPLFYYRISCVLEKDGHPVGGGLGSCNSWETKYRYRWFQSLPAGMDASKLLTRDATLFEPGFAISKKETGGKYGKPMEYWQRWEAAIESGEATRETRKKKDGGDLAGYKMGGVEYRVPNDQFADTINSVLKIGKKRAYLDSTLSATGLSQYFTQDLEDNNEPIDTGGHQTGTQAAANHVAQKKIADAKPAASASGFPEVDALWVRMGTKRSTIVEVLTEMYRDMVELLGQDRGDEEYIRICKQFAGGDPKTQQPLKIELAHRVALELWKRMNTAGTISDEDLPEILQPQETR